MNYKTLIAFLGKNQMKDWATPKSDWIIAGVGSGWNDEFKQMQKPSKIKNNRYTPSKTGTVLSEGAVNIQNNKSLGGMTWHYKYWYIIKSDGTDVMIFGKDPENAENVEKAKSLAEENDLKVGIHEL
jgi:hypothetical protein